MPSLPSLTPPSAAPPIPLEFRFKPARQPMLWAAVSYAAGIIAATYLSRPPSWWALAALAFVASGQYFTHKRRWLALALALAAMFLAGALHLQLRGSSSTLDPSLSPFAYGPEVEITALVIREGRFREAAAGELAQTLDVETEEIVTDSGTRFPVHSGVRLGLYSQTNSASAEVRTSPRRLFCYGERLRLPSN